MKTLLSFFFICFIAISSFSQIPNADFENWTQSSLTLPSGWNLFGNVSQYTPAVNGNYAAKIQKNPNNMGEPGAIIYGDPSNGSFNGGIPFSQRPDSIVGYFKHYTVPGDSAWVLVVFKYQGNPISVDLFYLTGTDSLNYSRLAFKLNLPPVIIPDTLIIGVTSTNPNASYLGSWIVVDSLHFIGTTQQIPNGNFENWTTINLESLDSWNTSNNNLMTPAVTKTTDANSGIYAMRLENLPLGGSNYTQTFALCGQQGESTVLPGFPVLIRDTTFNGYYKYFPQNNDSLTIGVFMYSLGTQVGGGFFQTGVQQNAYTYFSTPIYYIGSFTGVPDSASVFATPFSTTSNIAKGNSVLYIDKLSLDNVLFVPQNIVSTDLNVYPNPFKSDLNIKITVKSENIYTISIFDIAGREMEQIYKGKLFEGINNVSYKNNNLQSGTYFIVVKSNNNSETTKIILQK